MKNSGMADEEIVRGLRERGVSPKEINDAFGQAQIKSAVSSTGELQGMQHSIMEQGQSSEFDPPAPIQRQNLNPQVQELPEQQNYAPPQQEEYAPQQSYSETPSYNPQDGYGDYGGGYDQGGYDSGTGVDTDLVIEIAEQVFSEKIKKFQAQLEETTEFKVLAQTKIDHIDSRLKKIESIIDKLQISILGRIGSYGDSLDSIKKEMSMMQDSFSKAIKNPPHSRKK